MRLIRRDLGLTVGNPSKEARPFSYEHTYAFYALAI
jgi:hypothetical protein